MVGNSHAQEGALARIHRRFLELARRHLAQAFETADFDLTSTREDLAQKLLLVTLVAGVGGLAALGQAVERRLGKVEVALLDQARHLSIEEGHQQGGDVGAVDVGVGHDDDPLVTQLVGVELTAGAAAERLHDVGDLLVALQLVFRGAGDVQDLAAQRQDRLAFAVARLLRRAAGGIALDQEDLRALGARRGAVRELARQAQLARRVLPLEVLLLAPPQAFLGPLDDPFQQGPGAFGVAAQPVVEVILDRRFDQLRGDRRGEAVLGLSLELGVVDEDRQHGHAAAQQVVGGQLAGLAVADQLAVGLHAAQQAAPEALLVAAAVAGRHGVAVGADEAVLVHRPGDRPLDAALLAGELGLAEEGLRGQGLAAAQAGLDEVAQAVGEVQRVAGRGVTVLVQQALVALPADLHAAEKVSLRAGHAVEPLGPEVGRSAEDFGVRHDRDGRAAPVLGGADRLEFALGLAALVLLAPDLAVARDLDAERGGQGVDHGEPDAVQAARGGVGLVRELGAGMERRQDDLEGRLLAELRVGVDRDAAAVVRDRDLVARRQFDLDTGREAGNGLVHGVVDQFGDEVVQGPLVRAADVHARATAHRLEALEDLDVLGRVVLAPRLSLLEEIFHSLHDHIRLRPSG